MVVAAKLKLSAAKKYARIPARLHNGDAMRSPEFLRLYEKMPDLKKAELIDGTVYMGSPVSADHSEPDALIQTWLGMYAIATPGVAHHLNTTVVLDPENTLQPDGVLRFRKPGEKVHFVEGPPALILEVAATSASIDMGRKLKACERNRVPEYLVWLVNEGMFKWHILRRGKYAEQQPEKGILASPAFTGLSLNVDALLMLDGQRVVAQLQKSLRSQAHEDFVRALARSAG